MLLLNKREIPWEVDCLDPMEQETTSAEGCIQISSPYLYRLYASIDQYKLTSTFTYTFPIEDLFYMLPLALQSSIQLHGKGIN